MGRRVFEGPASLERLAGFSVLEQVRFTFPSPRRGGPRLKELRAAVRSLGVVRISGTPARVFVDIDPGEPESPLVALDGIVRSDPVGLERAILSALPHVDEIVVGVDARSDAETREVAEAYADIAWIFGAADIGLSEEEWKADKIHFANARNLGRARVTAPWSFFLDSDEYVHRTEPVREAIKRAAPSVGTFLVTVDIAGQEACDCQRIARVGYRWQSPVHNRLLSGGTACPLDMRIVHDPDTVRAPSEVVRRTEQRHNAVEDLVPEIANGDMIALFHYAKHKLAFLDTVEEGIKLVDEFRKKTRVHDIGSDHRAWLALLAAFRLYEKENFTEAEIWAFRAMLDGPRIEALALLGDIAEDQGRLDDALSWYEAACVVPETNGMRVKPLLDLRWGRREALRRALGKGPPDLYPGVAVSASQDDERPHAAGGNGADHSAAARQEPKVESNAGTPPVA